MAVDEFQADIARIALSAAGHGFALAGGNALVAHGLVERPTEDVDLFSPEPRGAAAVSGPVQSALAEAGFEVVLVEQSDEFVRLEVTKSDRVALLDLARDWRQHPPVVMSLGPVLHVEDAVGSKAAALVGRGLPRDYVDVAAALARFGRTAVVSLAFRRDPGLRIADFSHAARRLDQLADHEFAAYGLSADAVAELRARFADWPREVAGDDVLQQARQLAHEPPPRPGANPERVLERRPPDRGRGLGR